VSPEVRDRVQRQAELEVARLGTLVRTACAGAVAELTTPVVLGVNLSFDVSGRENARSVAAKEPLSGALRTCILITDAGGLRVDAPGVPVSARVRMELP